MIAIDASERPNRPHYDVRAGGFGHLEPNRTYN
jgi:hypothetical protein